MTIHLKPETERLVREELDRGRFHSVDEMIVEGVHARHTSGRIPPIRKSKAEAITHIRESRRGNRLPDGINIKDLINEGRA